MQPDATADNKPLILPTWIDVALFAITACLYAFIDVFHHPPYFLNSNAINILADVRPFVEIMGPYVLAPLVFLLSISILGKDWIPGCLTLIASVALMYYSFIATDRLAGLLCLGITLAGVLWGIKLARYNHRSMQLPLPLTPARKQRFLLLWGVLSVGLIAISSYLLTSFANSDTGWNLRVLILPFLPITVAVLNYYTEAKSTSLPQ